MNCNYIHWPNWPQNRTAIIAEVGTNHGGDKDLAWELIRSAHENGADFVKLQSFVTEEFFHPSLEYYSSTESLELSFDVQRTLFKKAGEEGIKLITTPFDLKSVDLVNEFAPAAFKIASMDNDNIPLIRYIAEKQRPILVSTGMADLGEIQKIIEVVTNTGNDKLILLHCISDYPPKPQDLTLSMIDVLKSTFNQFVGFSDHTIGVTSSFIAISLGVAVIEKHFTTDRLLARRIPDADHEISIEPGELKCLREFSESVPIMIGHAPRQLTENEVKGRTTLRRGLYARRDISAGESLTLENTMFLRPVKGISVGKWDEVAGMKVNKYLLQNAPITFSDIGL